MSEEKLHKAIEECKAGKQESFAVIYDHFSPKLYKFVFFRVGHKEIAEDILADTFVKAWNKISQVNSALALQGWLYQIAKNNIIDYYRVRKTTIDLDEVAGFLEDSVNPVDDLNLELDQKRILKFISQLPTDQQQVIKYKFFEDLTNEEIAFVMNKSEGSVRVIQHRALARLKELANKKTL